MQSDTELKRCDEETPLELGSNEIDGMEVLAGEASVDVEEDGRCMVDPADGRMCLDDKCEDSGVALKEGMSVTPLAIGG